MQACSAGMLLSTVHKILTLRVGEVDHIVALEDVDLLNARNGVDTQPLERVLQPLVVCAGGLVHRLLLSAGTGGGLPQKPSRFSVFCSRLSSVLVGVCSASFFPQAWRHAACSCHEIPELPSSYRYLLWQKPAALHDSGWGCG